MSTESGSMKERPGQEEPRRKRVSYVEEEITSSPPSSEEVEEWAERERRRRRAWLEGPSEEERREWAHRTRLRRERCDRYDAPGHYSWEENPDVERFRRDAQLASQGAMRILWEWPFWTWARLVRAGRDYEERFYTPVRTRRITYYD